MATQKYKNLAQSILASAYTAGNTTITVTTGEGALFPSTGDFYVAMDNPPAFFLKCTSRAGDILTVSSTGQEGTTATNKAIGVKVTQVLTEAALDGIRADMASIGTYASLPVSGMKAGDHYYLTDGPYMFVYNGAAWIPIIPGQPALTIPPSTGWNWENRDGSNVSTFNNSGGQLYGFFTKTGATSVRGLYRTAPATPYSVTILSEFDFSGFADNSPGGEIGWQFGFRDSGGKLAILGLGLGFSGSWFIDVNYFTNATTFSSQPIQGHANSGSSISVRNLLWLRISDNGTNILFYYSIDGINFVLYFSVSRTTFMGSGPTQIFWGGYVNSGAVQGRMLSYLET